MSLGTVLDTVSKSSAFIAGGKAALNKGREFARNLDGQNLVPENEYTVDHTQKFDI